MSPFIWKSSYSKANKIKLKVSLSNVYYVVAHVDVDPTLALRCAPNENYQPTVQRFANFGQSIRTVTRYGSHKG